jgi:hypothetical protein
MRTLTIILVAAVVFLLAQQLPAESRGRDQEARGASQAVTAGQFKCFAQDFPQESSTIVSLEIGGGLGISGLPPREDGAHFIVFADATQAGDCSDLIPALAEQVPHGICEIGSTLELGGDDLSVFFLCTGRADAVISAVGKMARAVNRLGQS